MWREEVGLKLCSCILAIFTIWWSWSWGCWCQVTNFRYRDASVMGSLDWLVHGQASAAMALVTSWVLSDSYHGCSSMAQWTLTFLIVVEVVASHSFSSGNHSYRSSLEFFPPAFFGEFCKHLIPHIESFPLWTLAIFSVSCIEPWLTQSGTNHSYFVGEKTKSQRAWLVCKVTQLINSPAGTHTWLSLMVRSTLLTV